MNIKKILLILLIATSSMLKAQQLFTYDWPTDSAQAILSDKYRVVLEQNGRIDTSEVILSNSKDLDIPDYARQFRGGRTMNWTMFSYDFKQPITITVEKLFGTGTQNIEVFPSAFNIQSTISEDGKKVTFSLTNSKYVSVNFKSTDNKHTSDGVVKHMMMVFADTLETDVPNKTGSGVHVYSKNSTFSQLQAATTIYFPRGYHNLNAQCADVSNLGPALANNKRIYFEGGAYVHGRITKAGASYVKIFGRGVLSGRDFKWNQRLASNGGVVGVNSFDPAESHIGIGDKNAGYSTIDGIIVCDGAGHGINLGHDATYIRTKLWGWHPNNDGARPWGSNNKIDRCFFHACDDAVYNKGLTVTNTIFWQGFNGSIVCLGWDGPYNTENTTLTNNYILYPEWRNIGNNNGIVMSQCDYDMKGINVTFKNLFVDGNISALVNLHTNSDRSTVGDYNLPQDWAKTVGYVSGITFDNVVVRGGQYSYSGTGYTQTQNAIRGLIKGASLTNGDKYYIKNVSFKDVWINNECLNSDTQGKYITIDAATTSNITFSGCSGNAVPTKLERGCFTLFPNPATDIVKIGNANSSTLLEMYNQAGNVVLKERGNMLNVGSLSKGVYFVKINNGVVLKLIK